MRHKVINVLVVLDFLSAIFPRDTTELLSGDNTTAAWGRLLLGETGGRWPVSGDGIKFRCAGIGCSFELCGRTFSDNDINFLTASGSSAPASNKHN